MDIDAMDIDGDVDVNEEIEGVILDDPVLYHAPIDAFQLMNYSDAATRSSSPMRAWMTSFFSRAQQATKPGPMSLHQMLRHQTTPLPAPILKESAAFNEVPFNMFRKILAFTDPRQLSINTSLEIAQELLTIGFGDDRMKDELYVQLFKQTRSNSDLISKTKTWKLFHLVSCTMPPSTEFSSLYVHHVQHVSRDDIEHPDVRDVVSRTWTALKAAVRSRKRKHVPSLEEIDAHMSNKKMAAPVAFLDGTFEMVSYDIGTTVLDAVNQIATLLELGHQNDFALFESLNGDADEGCSHRLLYDQRHIADVVIEFAEDSKDGRSRHLLFKKVIFRESDEYVLESQFLNLSYLQAQYDYLIGNYPVGDDDAARLCAFQLFSEYAHNLPKAEELRRAIHKFTNVDIQLTAGTQEYRKKVLNCFEQADFASREDARTAFLSLLKTLPYGMAIFFKVGRVEDPTGILPPKLVLGINKNGMHFFRAVTKEYLTCIDFKDVSQYGYGEREIYFKMKMCGVLRAFRFESGQGEDVCMAINTYMCEIIKGGPKEDRALDLPDADFGERYEGHLAKMRAAIEDATSKETELMRLQNAHTYEIDCARQELNEVMQSRIQSQDQRGKKEAELNAFKTEIKHLKALLMALDKNHSDKQPATALGPDGTDANALLQSEADLRSKLNEILKEKSMLEQQIAASETARETETQRLKLELQSFEGDKKNACASLDGRNASLVEDVASMTVMLNECKKALEQKKAEKEEAIRLSTLRDRVEQEEKERRTTIDKQLECIHQLEGQYSSEQLRRKKVFSKVQDLLGKIRVYARVRPLLAQERRQGHQQAVMIHDAYTLAHPGKRDGSLREYEFDEVLPPEATQKDVFEKTEDLIQLPLDGHNVCIFAYGQTGSGKTHTIYGKVGDPGLAPQGISELFRLMADRRDRFTYVVDCYMLELYRDALMDLLSEDQSKDRFERRQSETQLRPSLSPRLSPMPRTSDAPKASRKKRLSETLVDDELTGSKEEGGLDRMVRLAGVTMKRVHSVAQLTDVFEKGHHRRHVAATKMNIESSRSHLIMSIVIEATDRQTHCKTTGKLTFVDLAGSERLKKSGSVGEQLKEAQAINKSLSALGDVISALARGEGHIPYRNHKLTMLMSDSIGGNAKTLMFVNVSPSKDSLDETQNSLQYATRVRSIKNDASQRSDKEAMRLKQQMSQWKECAFAKDKKAIQSMLEEFR